MLRLRVRSAAQRALRQTTSRFSPALSKDGATRLVAAPSPLYPNKSLPALNSYALAVFVRSYSTSSTTTNEPTAVNLVPPDDAVLAKKRIAIARRLQRKIKAQEEMLVSALKKDNELALNAPKVPQHMLSLSERVVQLVSNGIAMRLHGMQLLVEDPKAWQRRKMNMVEHHWLRTKRLCVDIAMSARITGDLLTGKMLSRRERNQVRRTIAYLESFRRLWRSQPSSSTVSDPQTTAAVSMKARVARLKQRRILVPHRRWIRKFYR